MRFPIAALTLLSTTAATTILSSETESLDEFTSKETYQHPNLQHLDSWNSVNGQQLRRRKRRTSSFGGILQNDHLHDRSIECSLQEVPPLEADVGILSSCPPNTICVAHPESIQGGFCQHRDLQDLSMGDFCRSNSRFDALIDACDCSMFNSTTQHGSFVCLVYAPGHCFQEYICGSLTVKQSFDDYHKSEYCYEFEVPISSNVCYHYMASTLDPDELKSCSISVNGVNCNYCRIIEQGVDGVENGCLEIDCSNTEAGVAGSDCLGSLVVDAILRDLVPEPPSALPTVFPTLTTSGSLSTSSPTMPSTMRTNAPTVVPPSATNQTTNEPIYSLTAPPNSTIPRYSLTAPPAMVSTSPPTFAPSSLPSDGSTPTGATTPLPTLIPTPTPTLATPSSLTPTSSPQVPEETRGPSDVSSITDNGPTTSGSAAHSHRLDAVLPLVILVTLASLIQVHWDYI